MPATPQSINRPKLLIGEGTDEVRFFSALLKHLGINDVQVEGCGGKSKLASYLATLNEPRPGFREVVSLGITRDADSSLTPDAVREDNSAAHAFRSVQDALRRAGLPVPQEPVQPAGDTRRVSIFILPDCQNPGMLEDLCLSSIEDTEEFSCINDLMTCVQGRGRQGPSNMAKARVHAWLATQSIPDLRLGEAAEQTVSLWPWEHPKFEPIKTFLRSL